MITLPDNKFSGVYINDKIQRHEIGFQYVHDAQVVCLHEPCLCSSVSKQVCRMGQFVAQ